MSCVKPLTAYWRTASRVGITFDVVHSATKVPFQLPCGRCIGCRVDRATQWGLRCLHEAKQWPHNQYVTLTYSDDNLPVGGTLVLADVQRFVNKLRKYEKRKFNIEPVRYFAGAEYGEENRRPHYHLLLFNCWLPDLRFHTINKRGESLYTSKIISECWSEMGHCTIGAVTYDSAVYSAKYALKKVLGKGSEADALREKRYVVYDDCGEVHERLPEFAVMSRNPGIGSGYYSRFGEEVRNHDNVVVDGRKVRPPRFYDYRTKQVNESLLDKLKKVRKRKAVLNRADNTDERLRVKEKLMLIAAEKKERSL